MPLLTVRNLSVRFLTADASFTAVSGLDLTVEAGETVAVVGESGSGKSVSALALMRLLPKKTARITADELSFDGREILSLPERELRSVRGGGIGMVFQDPMTSLNPLRTVGAQICEAILAHRPVSPKQARDEALDLLATVRIPDPIKRFSEYPHRLSGGMRQRIMIAAALACSPKLLIADEPTTALDVTTQAQVLELIDALKQKTGMGVLFITHDLGVVAQIAARVVVMYAGQKVEEAPVEGFFRAPEHPYSRALLGAMPQISTTPVDVRALRLNEIPGAVSARYSGLPGCRFAPRCTESLPHCRDELPPIARRLPDRSVRCHLHANR